MGVSYLFPGGTSTDGRALFLAARSDEALIAISRDDRAEAVLLRARCQLRRNDPAGAVVTLSSQRHGDVSRNVDAEHHTLLAASLSRCGRAGEAIAHYAHARDVTSATESTAALELSYFRALDAWTIGDRDAERIIITAESISRPSPEAPDSARFETLRAQVLELRGSIAADRNDFREQAALLVKAWLILCALPRREFDVWIAASVLRHLAPLVWELDLVDEAEILWRAIDTVQWSPEVASALHVVHRAIAWRAALAGDYRGALVRHRYCFELAPTNTGRLASTLDRAYLAAEVREYMMSWEEMVRAGELARTISWDALALDEGELLLDLTEAYARSDDPGLARRWLARYQRNDESWKRPVLRCAGRQDALECDAEAAVLSVEGRTDEAAACRRSALRQWDQLGHSCRAALSAIALAELTGSTADISQARKHAKTFPRSWMGRRVKRLSMHRIPAAF